MLSQKPLIRQTQELRLKLSLQTVQTLKLLAQTTMDLKASIQEALETNPALEVRDEPWEVSLDSLEEKSGEEMFSSLLNPELPSIALEEAMDRDVPQEPVEPQKKHSEALTESEESYQSFTEDPGYYDSAGATDLGSSAPRDSIQTIIENTLSSETSLSQYLLEQWVLLKISPQMRLLGERLIQNLDRNGFHVVDPVQLLLKDEDLDLLRLTLEELQKLDPVGTCVNDWRESLVVQMRIHGGFSQEAQTLVREFGQLLLEGKPKAIAQALRVSQNEIEPILDEIKTLNPFPGRAHAPSGAADVIPDLILEERDGEPVLTMNDEALPVLGINPQFITEKKDTDIDKASLSFMRSKVRDAHWFIQSILYRQSTLLKVGYAVCSRQIEFLRRGPLYLKPLILNEIAQEVGLHPSTISRATNGKYIQTKWGVLELKDFFTRNSGKGDSSKQSIKEMIKTILVELQQEKRISDQMIRDKLDAQGVKIALRTVNKYRNEIEVDQ